GNVTATSRFGFERHGRGPSVREGAAFLRRPAPGAQPADPCNKVARLRIAVLQPEASTALCSRQRRFAVAKAGEKRDAGRKTANMANAGFNRLATRFTLDTMLIKFCTGRKENAL
ncbi:MAG: hypothetical protein ACJ73N_06655, partial [Bryobacteraceae bacterium]